MAQHSPKVGVAASHFGQAGPMAGTSMPGMSGMNHTDSAAGDIGYKPETHERYRPQTGRADRHAGNVIQDSYLAGNL